MKSATISFSTATAAAVLLSGCAAVHTKSSVQPETTGVKEDKNCAVAPQPAANGNPMAGIDLSGSGSCVTVTLGQKGKNGMTGQQTAGYRVHVAECRSGEGVIGNFGKNVVNGLSVMTTGQLAMSQGDTFLNNQDSQECANGKQQALNDLRQTVDRSVQAYVATQNQEIAEAWNHKKHSKKEAKKGPSLVDPKSVEVDVRGAWVLSPTSQNGVLNNIYNKAADHATKVLTAPVQIPTAPTLPFGTYQFR